MSFLYAYLRRPRSQLAFLGSTRLLPLELTSFAEEVGSVAFQAIEVLAPRESQPAFYPCCMYRLAYHLNLHFSQNAPPGPGPKWCTHRIMSTLEHGHVGARPHWSMSTLEHNHVGA